MCARMRVFAVLFILAALFILSGHILAASGVPEVSRVVLSRTERVLIPPGWMAPERFYPQGRVDYAQVQKLLENAIRVYTDPDEDTNPWREIARPSDVVGIQVDMQHPPVSQETINAIIDALIQSGISRNNVIAFAASERDLFAAGIALNPKGRGVRTMGADSEGFRGDISRIVLDYCTVVINVGRLQVDEAFGMRGCLAAATVAIPETRRRDLREHPERLPQAAANPVLRAKTKLHILEAYQPVLRDTNEKLPPVWEYRGLLLSEDPVATDTIGARILNSKLEQIDNDAAESSLSPVVWDYLYNATEKFRLGNSDPEKISVDLVGTNKDLLLDTGEVNCSSVSPPVPLSVSLGPLSQVFR